MPYDDKIEQIAIADFKRLMATNFLDDLAVDVQDYKFSNGVIGKMVVYNMEERQRVKIVDYVGSKQGRAVEDRRGAEEAEPPHRARLVHRPGLIRKVAGVVREMYAEKGYEYVEVKPEIKPVSAATKTVNLTFHITEGPKVRIRDDRLPGQQGDRRREAERAR